MFSLTVILLMYYIQTAADRINLSRNSAEFASFVIHGISIAYFLSVIAVLSIKAIHIIRTNSYNKSDKAIKIVYILLILFLNLITKLNFSYLS